MTRDTASSDRGGILRIEDPKEGVETHVEDKTTGYQCDTFADRE